jgi:hypothetical protein
MHRKVTVYYKSEKAGNVQLFWGREGASAFSSSRVSTVYAPANQWVFLTFDMSNHPEWRNQKIVALRLDPSGVSSSESAKYTWLDWLETGF